MSSFGAKLILRKDIVALYVWFTDSAEICEYLDMSKDPRMSGSFVNQTEVDKKQMQRTTRKIQGGMIKYLFDYQSGCEIVFTKDFICDWENCLDFQFDDCLKKEDLNDEGLLNHSVSEEDTIDDDCNLDNNEGTRSPDIQVLKGAIICCCYFI